ncbi:hypothetical protein ACWGNZ_00785 [Sphingomonas zeae]
MSDEFWNEIERTSADLRSKQKEEIQRRTDNWTFFKDILPTLFNVADRYQQKLRTLGHNASVETSDDFLTFRLTWANGASLHVTATREDEFGCLKIETGEGQGWPTFSRPQDDALYDRGMFNPYMYEGRLQALVREFIKRAPENGGL